MGTSVVPQGWVVGTWAWVVGTLGAWGWVVSLGADKTNKSRKKYIFRKP